MKAEIIKKLSAISPEESKILEEPTINKKLYTDDDSFVIDSKHMLQKGKLIDIRPHTRFADFPLHSHNYVEIIYMCSGSTIHNIEGTQELVLNEGELLLLGKNTSHSIKRAEKSDIAVNFIVLPQFFDYALELIGGDNVLGQFLLGSLRGRSNGVDYLYFKVAGIDVVQNLIENLVLSLLNHEPNYKLINKVTMGLLFLQLLNHTENLGITGGTGGANLLLFEVLREIEENYKSASLTFIAKSHRISTAYLSKVVSDNTGFTYKELLQEKRLNKAEYFLLYSSQSVSSIIENVGYSNSTYFFRIFKERFGVSPKEYRKQNAIK